MTNQEIVAKLWNLCNVLRDDGITYHQYVTELTYILFLKMAKETGTEDKIPEKYRWDRLAEKDGLALKKFYEDLLRELGEKGTGRIQEIYSGARSNIEEPANLKKIITNINDLDWYSAKDEYSCAATPQIRQTGNRLSGLAETAYASLLAQCFV